MDYKEILKKYWFAGLITLFLTAGLIFFISDSLTKNVKAVKNDDGQSVLFSYDGNNYTADDLYSDVYNGVDIGVILPILEVEVYRNALELDKAMESDAIADTDQFVLGLKTQVGEDWKNVLDSLLIQEGYVSKSGEAGLLDYFKIIQIRSKVETNYISEHKEVYEPYMKENDPRLVSHILVKMADPDNPTEAEQEKLDKVKEELAKDGAVFSDIASQYSDDGSREQGGSLGLVTKESNEKFVPEFRDAVYTIKTNETSEWIKTEYGYHIIKIDASTYDEFLELNNYSIINALFQENPKLRLDITWDQIVKQDLKFGSNEELNKAIKKHYTGEEE